MEPSHRHVIGIMYVGAIVLALFVLWQILWTVVFAITVAAVLLPVRHWLVDRGASPRVAGLGATMLAFVVGTALIVPVLVVIYQRRERLIGAFRRIPETIPIQFGGTEFVVQTDPLVAGADTALREIAVTVASGAPRFALEFFVFTLLVYGLLRRPDTVHTALHGLVSSDYTEDIRRLHDRAMTTLNGIYVLQLSTAVLTFVLAALVFALLGYPAPLELAVLAGILQFVPVIGPSVLIVLLAVADVMNGLTGRAAVLLVVGLIVVGMLPDLGIKTMFADRVGHISAGPYFVGFVGGVFTIGPIGFIVGPLVVAVVLEATEMLSEETAA